MRRQRKHRPKPARLRKGAAHKRVAYFNRITGWYELGARHIRVRFHGETPLTDLLMVCRAHGVELSFVPRGSGCDEQRSTDRSRRG